MYIVVGRVVFEGSDVVSGQVREDILRWFSLLKSRVVEYSVWSSGGGVFVLFLLETEFLGLYLAGCEPCSILQAGFIGLQSFRWLVEVEVVCGQIAGFEAGKVHMLVLQSATEALEGGAGQCDDSFVDQFVWDGSGLGLMDVEWFRLNCVPVGYKVDTQVMCFQRGVMVRHGCRSRYCLGAGEVIVRQNLFYL